MHEGELGASWLVQTEDWQISELLGLGVFGLNSVFCLAGIVTGRRDLVAWAFMVGLCGR